MTATPQLVHTDAMPMQTEVLGVAVREDVLFTDAKGRTHNGVRRAAEKILTNLNEPLRRTLRPKEVVFCAATMTAPLGIAEQLTMSWWLYTAYSMALVVTSERVLVFPVTRSGEWRGAAIQSLELGDIEKAKTGGWISRTLMIRTRDGKKVTFQRLKMRDAAKVKAVLPVLMEGKTSTSSTGWQTLCIQCLAALSTGIYSCHGCNLQYRSERKLAWRTLIPGGGYFYVGLTGAGVIAALVEVIFLFELLGGVLLLVNPTSAESRADGISVLIGFGLFLCLEKSVMYLHARRFVRWFLPESKMGPKVG